MYKQKNILFFSIIISLFLFIILLSYFFCIKFPCYIPANYGIKEHINIKEHYAQKITKPKIIIASGSNSLFGICTPLLKEKTNKEIINFGLNAGLPKELLFSLIKKYAKPNDIILMPLEYHYYSRKRIDPVHVMQMKNLTTWGIEYFHELSAIKKLQLFILSIPTVHQRIINYKVKFPIRSYEEYMIDKNQSAILSPHVDYCNSANSYGDFCIDNKSKLNNSFTEIYFNTAELKDYNFKQLKDFSDYLAKQNITMLLTYPVSIQNPNFDLSKKEHLEKIKALNKKFKEHKLNVIGIPELFNFELIYSCDTCYHLNAEGAMLRSLYLADAINCYLAGIPQEIPDLKEYKILKKIEARRYLNEYRKLGYFLEEKQ